MLVIYCIEFIRKGTGTSVVAWEFVPSGDPTGNKKRRNTMMKHLKMFMQDEEGATAVEYGLLVALIAAVIIGAVGLLGGTLNTVFGNVNTALNTAITPPSIPDPVVN